MKVVIMEVLLFLMILCFMASIASSETNTLKQADVLNSSASTFLVSANKNFTLRFFTPGGTNRTYLAIIMYNRFNAEIPVWIGNRETPLLTNSSAMLLIDASGRLVLTHNGSSWSYPLSSKQTSLNVTATLHNSGNFILREMNPDGSYGKELWSSFDNPTDSLFPGMKLGVNHRTGRNWTVTSWLRDDNPEPVAFSLEWEPKKHQLVIKHRGVVHWTSGELKNATRFEHTYEIIHGSTKEEEYFSYFPFEK